jgi:hypothetical protein
VFGSLWEGTDNQSGLPILRSCTTIYPVCQEKIAGRNPKPGI